LQKSSARTNQIWISRSRRSSCLSSLVFCNHVETAWHSRRLCWWWLGWCMYLIELSWFHLKIDEHLQFLWQLSECSDKFNISNGSGKDQGPCPRSRSHHCAAKPDGTYDVIIIGAGLIFLFLFWCLSFCLSFPRCHRIWPGCIGACIARELSKSSSSVLVLEAADGMVSLPGFLFVISQEYIH
jgi:hypothetical protein